MVFKDSKKALRKNPKLKRRNIKKKDIFQSKKITAFFYRLALLVEREHNSISALSVKKEVFPEKKKKELV